jgi:hypothetical protein
MSSSSRQGYGGYSNGDSRGRGVYGSDGTQERSPGGGYGGYSSYQRAAGTSGAASRGATGRDLAPESSAVGYQAYGAMKTTREKSQERTDARSRSKNGRNGNGRTYGPGTKKLDGMCYG